MTIAMKFLDMGYIYPPVYKKITGQWVFDINLYLKIRSRFVVGVHLYENAQVMTYRSVVSSDIVIILITIILN